MLGAEYTLRDNSALLGQRYYYWLEVINRQVIANGFREETCLRRLACSASQPS